jgi:predicted metallopeptidase
MGVTGTGGLGSAPCNPDPLSMTKRKFRRKLMLKIGRVILMGVSESMIKVRFFDGKYFINESYRPIAKALIEKYEELRHIAVNEILFVDDNESPKRKGGSIVFAQMGLVPDKWTDVIYQITGRRFAYMLEVFKVNTALMSREQIIALIYHELRHIGVDGKLRNHDIEEWTNVLEKLGANWNSTRSAIPNILDDGINWENIEGPTSLFPTEVTLRVVK